MLSKFEHSWDLSAKDARVLQAELVTKLAFDGDLSEPGFIAGVDVSYEKASNLSYAGVVVFSYLELEIVEQQSAVLETTFPYVPGLLTFREGPATLAAFRKIECEPDILVFDGHGQAHPKGFGIAAHMGLLLDKPSIGCAKKMLCGTYEVPGPQPGSVSPILYKGKQIGTVLRTKEKVNPVFVSAGHRISLSRAVRFILSTCRGYRLPEVTRQAHLFVNQVRRGVL